ncbi:hypothetical protein H0264_07755 [Nocardia huaxiensis]|uniref:Uncharacterized protein n=1 Tax=Nocardia huaxiensis TaxID=2755382 RepID=A0A7D6ZJ00_9NOCA|nr:hypothetical protein [Nocardia huaxiensis]QLY32159.1 hypothetical protein H0264_07755 [Nocardia huaxiensis]
MKATGLGPVSRFLLSALAGCLATLLIGSVLYFVDDVTVKVIDHQRISRPAESTVTYDVNTVGIIEYRSGLFRRHVSYKVYVGCQPMDFGHLFEIDNGDVPPVISAAIWEPDGVRVRLDPLHELYFPIEKEHQFCWR